MLATLVLAIAPARADDDYPHIFVKMCDEGPDKKVSKERVMETVSKMFDKADTRQEGKLDKEQADAFYKSFTHPSGG
jgi:hypothetical protein